MAADSPTSTMLPPARLPWPTLSWIFARHLASLLIPLNSLAYLWTGPHAWYVAPLFMLPPIFALHFDSNATIERRQPVETTPAWPFDALVYVLAFLQLWIVYELVAMYRVQGFFSIDTVMAFVVVGGSSGFSIITAHELIHRRNRYEQWLGRLLLASVLQEHFYTEHLRGHHVRVGLPEDPATARFGEDYEHFYRRTVPAQFESAWRLECKRLGDERMSLFDRRQLRNRVVHGLVLGWGAGLVILYAIGLPAFLVFVLQALMASRLLEAVNYFEHWGLKRLARRVRPMDSWDTHAWFTYYGLTGLSRHADHHANPSRPYQQLRVFDEAPMLPTGYVGMVDLVMGDNLAFQKQAIAELQRRQLGPFHPEADPEDAARARAWSQRVLESEPAKPSGLLGPNAKGERGAVVVAKRFGVIAAIVLVTTFGVQLEAPGQLAFWARLLLNTWILAVFMTTLRIFRGLSGQGLPDSLSWSAALGVLFLVGVITTGALGF